MPDIPSNPAARTELLFGSRWYQRAGVISLGTLVFCGLTCYLAGCGAQAPTKYPAQLGATIPELQSGNNWVYDITEQVSTTGASPTPSPSVSGSTAKPAVTQGTMTITVAPGTLASYAAGPVLVETRSVTATDSSGKPLSSQLVSYLRQDTTSHDVYLLAKQSSGTVFQDLGRVTDSTVVPLKSDSPALVYYPGIWSGTTAASGAAVFDYTQAVPYAAATPTPTPSPTSTPTAVPATPNSTTTTTTNTSTTTTGTTTSTTNTTTTSTSATTTATPTPTPAPTPLPSSEPITIQYSVVGSETVHTKLGYFETLKVSYVILSGTQNVAGTGWFSPLVGRFVTANETMTDSATGISSLRTLTLSATSLPIKATPTPTPAESRSRAMPRNPVR